MKSGIRSLIKGVLRSVGLLPILRKYQYRRDNEKYLNKFRGQDFYTVNYRGLTSKFSLKDTYSAKFFALYFKDSKVYEEEVLAVILDKLKPNSVFADVGSNIGYFACIASVYLKGGKVYTFEMAGENVKILQRNVALNEANNVTIEHGAVSSEDGFVMSQDSAVGNAVLRIVEDKKGDDLVTTRSISLDKYFSERDVVPDLFKIDVEGAEIRVLQGMKELLTKDISLLIEIHRKELTYFNSSMEEVIGILKDNNFKLTEITNDDKKNLVLLATKK